MYSTLSTGHQMLYSVVHSNCLHRWCYVSCTVHPVWLCVLDILLCFVLQVVCTASSTQICVEQRVASGCDAPPAQCAVQCTSYRWCVLLLHRCVCWTKGCRWLCASRGQWITLPGTPPCPKAGKLPAYHHPRHWEEKVLRQRVILDTIK